MIVVRENYLELRGRIVNLLAVNWFVYISFTSQ
jgi:hypothetical protein